MFLERTFVEKPWGRVDLPPEFGVPAGRRIGEIWYADADGPALPLLIKWLFTSEKLSIQVHPSDEDARRSGLDSGKEECWFIVDAEPGAVLGIGTVRAISDDELRTASRSGEIEQLIAWKPVRPGDFFYIPAGTVHAIGAGVTLVEVQQPADITYRLYDYGRPRALQLEPAVAVARSEPYSDKRTGHVSGSQRLVSGPHFWLHHVDSAAAIGSIRETGPYWLVPVEGAVTITGTDLVRGDCARVDRLDRIETGANISLLIAGICDEMMT